jgi:hypothetical protein
MLGELEMGGVGSRLTGDGGRVEAGVLTVKELLEWRNCAELV